MSSLQKFGDDQHARWLKERAAEKMYEALQRVKTWLETSTDDTTPEEAIEYIGAILAQAEGRHE